MHSNYTNQANTFSRVLNYSSNLECEFFDFSQARLSGQLFTDKISELIKKPFDISASKLIRFYLFDLGNNKSKIFIVFFHALLDATSMINTILPRLVKYRNKAKLSKLIPKKEQFLVNDFAQFSHDLKILYSLNVNNKMQYWSKVLNHDYSSFLTKKSADNESQIGQQIRFILDKSIKDNLILLKNKLSINLFDILLGSAFLLIHKITGQDQLIIKTNIDERILIPEFVDTVGCFINNVFLNAVFDKNMTFAQLLTNCSRNKHEAIANIVGYQDLVKYFRNQVLIASAIHFNIEPEEIEHGHYYQSQVYTHSGEVKNNLYIELDVKPDHIIGRIEYKTSIFPEEFVQSLINCYTYILTNINSTINNAICNIEIVSDIEFERMMYNINLPIYNHSNNKYTIPELFIEQVKKTPNSIALSCGSVQFTYKDLSNRVNQLSEYLKDNYKFTSNSLIGICLERNEYLIISILAILRINAAYVPIDPEFPEERISHILEDTNAKLIIINECYVLRFKSLLNSDLTVKMLEVDSQFLLSKLKQYNNSSFQLLGNGNDLAYVLYTSGTTGKPKGVMVEHMAYLSTIKNVQERHFPENLKLSTCSLTNYVFDIFGLEYGLPLLTGGTLTLGNKDMVNIDCAKYQFIQMTPSLYRIKKDHLNNTRNTKLLLGGESLTPNLLNNALDKFIEVINVYGPTETTIWSTSKSYQKIHYDSTMTGFAEIISIGKPFNNEHVYVLDNNMKPLPTWVPGELYIGGVTIARGYLNQDVLTQERFVDNPFQTLNQKAINVNNKLYKTGDLVRLLPCGELEYLNRNDSQVKVRGYRIELGEIEEIMVLHPKISQCTVIAMPGRDNEDSLLVAYYTADNKLGHDVLINHLSAKLPFYMIPQIIMYLEKWPLTVNGKSDKKALPLPIELISQTNNYVKPNNDLQLKLASMWADVLSTEVPVGIHDNFFALGGNSIIGMKLASQINQISSLEINAATIFKYPTIEQLSSFLLDKTIDICSKQIVQEGEI